MTLSYFSTPRPGALSLRRRGFQLGWIEADAAPAMPSAAAIAQAWREHRAVLLPGLLASSPPRFDEALAQSRRLYEQTLDGADVSESLDESPYAERLQPLFELTGVSYEDHDDQGVEKVFFDAWQDDEIVADNLWCKASWLSFDEDDASLRFRFSFGIEGYEDVASDHERQLWAAALTDAVFPESAAITDNAELGAILRETLDCDELDFMERIIYFNAPNGGALMHHDVERGHDGVVFAQMTGSTFWLALSKPALMDEIEAYLAQADAEAWPELRALAADRSLLSAHLDDPDHEAAEALMDREGDFFRWLIARDYAFVLRPGDALLMRQDCLETCVWHSVLCLGDEPGEGLSFALKKSG